MKRHELVTIYSENVIGELKIAKQENDFMRSNYIVDFVAAINIWLNDHLELSKDNKVILNDNELEFMSDTNYRIRYKEIPDNVIIQIYKAGYICQIKELY